MVQNYMSKFVTPEVAAKAVRSGDWVDYGFGAGFPELMDRALAARKEELKDRGGGARPGAVRVHLLQLAYRGL